MRNVSIEVSDYEYIVFNEAVEGAKQYYTEVFNDSNYSYLLIMDEDQVRELKDLIECYLLDEDTIVGCTTYDIVKDIFDNVCDEIKWLPYIYDEEDFEDDEY